jgi:PST family polysaccharide transporter
MTRSEHDELDTKIMRSSAWALLGFGGLNVASLLTTIVLARLLTPNDFGLVALTLAILAVAQIAQESGLGAALIVHREDLRPAAASVAVFAPVIGLGLYGVVFAAAPLLADLLDEQRLVDIVRVTALILALRGFSVMPVAVLQREMRFRAITTIELASGVAQSVTAIGLAAAGAGVWSLVAGQLALMSIQLALAWTFVPIRPSPFEAQRKTLLDLARFGRYVGIANIVNYANSSADGLVIGRMVGATPLGFFSVGKRLAAMPVGVIGNILGRGVYAALARLQGDLEGFRRVWLENIQRVALLAVPATIGIVFVAAPLVETLFGERWQPAVVVIQVLSLNGVVRTFSATSGEVFQALRRPHLRVVIEVAHLVLLLPALIVGTELDGIRGAAAGIVLVNLATGVPALAIVMRALGVTIRGLARAIERPAIGWALMTASMFAVRPFVTQLAPPVELVATIACAAIVYTVAIAMLARDLVHTMWLSLRGARVSPGARG